MGVAVGVEVLVGVYVADGMEVAVAVAVFVGVLVGGIKSVDVEVGSAVMEAVGVYVVVGVSVGEGVIDGVEVKMDGSGLEVTAGSSGVTVDAKVELGVIVADWSGASMTAIPPTQ